MKREREKRAEEKTQRDRSHCQFRKEPCTTVCLFLLLSHSRFSLAYAVSHVKVMIAADAPINTLFTLSHTSPLESKQVLLVEQSQINVYVCILRTGPPSSTKRPTRGEKMKNSPTQWFGESTDGDHAIRPYAKVVSTVSSRAPPDRSIATR